MSKSSFLLLSITVASLTAAAGVQAGGLRMGKPELRYEAHADLTSLRDDYYSFRAEAERAPTEIRYFFDDVASDCRSLATDFKAEAQRVARHFSGMVHSSGAEVASSAPEHS